MGSSEAPSLKRMLIVCLIVCIIAVCLIVAFWTPITSKLCHFTGHLMIKDKICCRFAINNYCRKKGIKDPQLLIPCAFYTSKSYFKKNCL